MSGVTPRSRSLFQVSVVAAIIVLLAAVLLNAVYYVQEKAERTVIEATVLNIEKGLEIEVRTREIRGQALSIRDLVGVNPVSFLAKPPEGYAGVCRKTKAPGEWCFDEATREIVYRPRLEASLEFREPGRRDLRWRVGSAEELAGGHTGGSAVVGGIRVFSTTSFVWH